jgi:hypothetical protein
LVCVPTAWLSKGEYCATNQQSGTYVRHHDEYDGGAGRSGGPGVGEDLPTAAASKAAAISGNPAKTGTFNFTVKATGGGLTATLVYQITVTVQGPPDQLVCAPPDNGGFLESGVCVLPDAVIGLPYQGHLVTSRQPAAR